VVVVEILGECIWSAQARAGFMSGAAVLRVAEAFSSETNYTVWNDLSSNLSSLSHLLQYTSFHDSFKAFLRQLFSPVLATVGWDAKNGEGTAHWRLSPVVKYGTIAQFFRAICSQLKHVSTIGKKLAKQQYVRQKSSQYGELWPTSG